MTRLAVSLAMLVGCGAQLADVPDQEGSGDDGSGPNNPGGPATRFLTLVAAADCAEAFACRGSFPDGDDAFVAEFGSAPADCVALEVGDDDAGTIDAEIAAGHVVFNDQAAMLCVSQIAFPSCAAYWNDGSLPSVCDAVLIGTIPDGGSCATDADCAVSDSTCNTPENICY